MRQDSRHTEDITTNTDSYADEQLRGAQQKIKSKLPVIMVVVGVSAALVLFAFAGMMTMFFVLLAQ